MAITLRVCLGHLKIKRSTRTLDCPRSFELRGLGQGEASASQWKMLRYDANVGIRVMFTSDPPHAVFKHGAECCRKYQCRFCLTETEMVATRRDDIILAKHCCFPNERVGMAACRLRAAMADLARDAVRVDAADFDPIWFRVDGYLDKAAGC